MAYHYIGNRHTKKLHVQEYADGRCKLDSMREEYRIDFDSLEDAMTYPKGKPPIFHECGICFLKMRKGK